MADFTEAERHELQAVAHALADAARAPALAHFRRRNLSVENKGAGAFDPVTEADRAVEAAMRAVLAARRPRDAVLGEEMAAQAGESGLTWVLDPIDGTRAYMSGAPTWGVLVAVADAGGPLFGLIDQPWTGERFWGGFGTAAMRGPRGEERLATRARAALAEATLYTTYPDLGSPGETAAFAALASRVRLTRYGFDCYAYALLAAGQVDLVVEACLQPYDVAAPIAVIEAAGGIVTDWQGGSAAGGGRVLAAGNAALHAAALEVLAQAG